jgi:hypothetical protein
MLLRKMSGNKQVWEVLRSSGVVDTVDDKVMRTIIETPSTGMLISTANVKKMIDDGFFNKWFADHYAGAVTKVSWARPKDPQCEAIWVHHGLGKVASQTGEIQLNNKDIFLNIYEDVDDDFKRRVQVRPTLV